MEYILLSILDDITFGDAAAVLAFVISLLSGIAYLKKHLQDWVKSAIGDDFTVLDGKVTAIQTELGNIQDGIERDKADNARYRILRFNDEILQHKLHSQEHFNQILQSITEYERYSMAHPTYPNGQAVAAINNIKRVNQKCFEEDSYLR